MDVKTCKQCGYLWVPRIEDVIPKCCPKCKSKEYGKKKKEVKK